MYRCPFVLRLLEMTPSASDPWELVKSGHYAEALETYDALCVSGQDSFSRHNRGLVWLLLKQYERALTDFQAVLDGKDPARVADTDY
jgi:tetratricopeptide (TPR) repeat protein